MDRATRGWNRFLTEQDTQLLARTSWAEREPFGPGTTAGEVEDGNTPVAGGGEDRHDAVDGGPARGTARGRPGADRFQEWSAGVAERGAISVDDDYRRLVANPNPWNRKRRNRPRDPVRTARDMRIVDELTPVDGDVVLECTPSGFTSSPLDALLTAARIDTVLLCGEATSGCVRATAIDGCVLGYRVGVVEDCFFDRIEASHWMSRFDLDQKYGDVIDSAAVLRYLEGVGAEAVGADEVGA